MDAGKTKYMCKGQNMTGLEMDNNMIERCDSYNYLLLQLRISVDDHRILSVKETRGMSEIE